MQEKTQRNYKDRNIKRSPATAAIAAADQASYIMYMIRYKKINQSKTNLYSATSLASQSEVIIITHLSTINATDD